MIKEKDIIFRVDSELKGKITKDVKDNGLSVYAWIRFVILKYLKY